MFTTKMNTQISLYLLSLVWLWNKQLVLM